jgi:hypothetical protein
MIVTTLVFTGLAFAWFATFLWIISPKWDIRKLDWQKIAREFEEGYASLRNEVDR